jgi:hypothetical protein
MRITIVDDCNWRGGGGVVTTVGVKMAVVEVVVPQWPWDACCRVQAT